MTDLSLRGVIRGKPVRRIIPDKAAPCHWTMSTGFFHTRRPNWLWVSDFTYSSIWSGLVYVAFVIDACAWRIVGWSVSRTANASLMLDALEQALHERRSVYRGGLVHHSRQGVHISIRYTRAPRRGRHRAFRGSVGDSDDNAFPRRSTDCTRPSWSIGGGHGDP